MGIIGLGSVGSRVATKLADEGVSPLWLLDKDHVEWRNLRLQKYEAADALARAKKAAALETHLRRKWPVGEFHGVVEDFLALSYEEQRNFVERCTVVVAATDDPDCQLRINEVCLAAEVPAVYPEMWVQLGLLAGEVGAVLWVMQGGTTPCYACYASIRRGIRPVEGIVARGVDFDQIANAAVGFVQQLLDEDEEFGPPDIMRPERNLFLFHTLGPVSEMAMDLQFRSEEPLGSRFATWPEEVLARGCPTCRPYRPHSLPTEGPRVTAPFPAPGSPPYQFGRRVGRVPSAVIFAGLAVLLLVAAIPGLVRWRQPGVKSKSLRTPAATPAPASPVSRVRWSVPVPGAGGQMAVSNRRVVFLARDGMLTGLDERGDVAWQHQFSSPSLISEDIIVGADARSVYVSINERVAAVDPTTGSVRWDHRVGWISSGPYRLFGDIIVTRDSAGLAAYDVVSGALVWRNSNADASLGSLEGTDGSTIYGMDPNNGLFALGRRTGAFLWRAKGFQFSIFKYIAKIDSERVYVVDRNTKGMAAFQKGTGSQQWSYELHPGGGYELHFEVAVPDTGRIFLFDDQPCRTIQIDRSTGGRIVEEAGGCSISSVSSSGSHVYTVERDWQETPFYRVRDAVSGQSIGKISLRERLFRCCHNACNVWRFVSEIL